MLRATSFLRAGEWPGEATDRVCLDYDSRHRRRLRLTGEKGTDLLLDLPRPVVLADGDGLLLEDGRIVAVAAAPERLLEIKAKNTAHLVRIAWHLGNRHLPTALLGDRLHIHEDHVIADMVRGLGGSVRAIEASFTPERGAYADGHGHGHSHDDHDHD
ncbi:MAG: urease accessory protein UreE [Alphaproteobacteria bacterium]